MLKAPIMRRPPPLLIPGSSPSSLHLAHQANFSPSTSTTPPYVLHVLSLPSLGYLFAGSDDSLRLFSPTLELLSTLKSTQKGITSLVRGAGEASTAVFSTARDGSVVGWDVRDLSKEAFRLKNKTGAPYLTCSQSSDLACLAVGAEMHHHEATIDFWYHPSPSPFPSSANLITIRDLRTLSLVQTYTEAHSDDLTSLSFHPSTTLPHVLLSASVDGLVNTYDVRIADEDDALMSTAQFGASVSSAGWMKLEGEIEGKGVWGVTTIETVQIWDVEQVSKGIYLRGKTRGMGADEKWSGQSELVVDLGDVREVCLEPWRSDYLIGAHYNPTLGGVCILTGTQKGDIAIINMKDPSRWILEQVLPGVGGRTLGGQGHADIVRCAYLDTQTSTVVTGGEDGRVCVWTL
ncbi:WD repeat-containing protein 89, partial [Phenoliferia sp. Uapishka_3]